MQNVLGRSVQCTKRAGEFACATPTLVSGTLEKVNTPQIVTPPITNSTGVAHDSVSNPTIRAAKTSVNDSTCTQLVLGHAVGPDNPS